MTDQPARSEDAASEIAPQRDAETSMQRWNYVVFVLQGIVVSSSKRVGSAHLLMPYLYVASGSPVFLAGMLMPIISASRLIGQIVFAPFVSASRTRKWFLFAGWIATAIGLAAAGLAVLLPIHWIVMVIFVCAALAMGIAKGVNALAFNDLISLNVSRWRRNSGIFAMSAAGGVVTISVTWLMYHLSTGRDTVDHYFSLALGAAGVTALAGIIILFFREKEHTPKVYTRTSASGASIQHSKPTLLQRMEKLPQVLRYEWFRRYLWMKCITATVILAMPFYAVHGATHHVHKHAAGLSAFVIATSIAVIVCGPMWRWLGKRSQRFSMALGCTLVGLAGVWALTIENVDALKTVVAHSFVFAAAAAGIQGVNGSRMLYLIDAAPKEDLTYYVAVSNTVSAVVALILAAFFGYIGQLQGVIWPVVLVMALNFASAAYSLTLHEPNPDEPPAGQATESPASS
ncbi:MAG: MFS transporter [Pseudomonadota bacterium]